MVVAVRIPTQGLLLMFLGAVLLRLAASDAYLRYVVPWMKWPLLASGILLILMALGPLFREERHSPDHVEHAEDDHAHEAANHRTHGAAATRPRRDVLARLRRDPITIAIRRWHGWR